MSDPPVIDDRTQQELFEDLIELADQYIDDWDSNSPDTAMTLLRVFSEFGTDVIQRLNSVPSKHRTAFLDSLGFSRRPPQAARVPLSFKTAGDLDRNIAIPGGTQAVATTPDGETKVFEIPQSAGFEATPSALTELYAVDPHADRIVNHKAVCDDESEALLSGQNLQQHTLYLGDESLLTLDPESVIRIRMAAETDLTALESTLVWEYYGVDEDETEGWHRLPTVENPAQLSNTPDSSIKQQLESLSATSHPSHRDTQYSVSLQLPGEFVSTTVADVSSRWIRCRLDDPEPACFRTEIESIRIHVGQSTETGKTVPDDAFTNDVPLTLDDESDIRPFGRVPQPPATVYLAANEAFTKRGAAVSITFHPPAEPIAETVVSESADTVAPESTDNTRQQADFGVLSGEPELSWEYWNGTGWAALDIQTDETEGLQTAGEVQFTVPDDLTETAVSGHENRWIRGRLVSGSYGQPSYEVADEGSPGQLVGTPEPPLYSTISVSYEHTDESFSHVIARNNETTEIVPETVDQYKPFRQLPDKNQTLYLGFDDALRDGPISICVLLTDTTYPQGFDPGIQWEYCTDPETDSWANLSVEDGTGGFTERGIVSLNFTAETTPHERFGIHCHWIRAVVRQDSFALERRTAASSTQPTVGEQQPGSSVAQPPVFEGIYPNTQWADNARTIKKEVLGSSDNSHDQSFQCAHGPVIDAEVWVDEVGSLSAGERDELEADHPDRVSKQMDQNGELSAFWVKWHAVDDFLETDQHTREYRIDRSTGTISFGDGQQGKIPPRGQDNIRVTYKTGGGEDGNVEADTITDLKSSISLVDSVRNPTASDGGAATESMESLVSRAANRIKTRGKAVTASDFEQVAAGAVRGLAKVRCRPQLDPDGNRKPGWITLLIVPEAQREKPMPSMELEQQVYEAVGEHAPVTLTQQDQSRIIVRGPTYVPASVDLTVQTTGVKSISMLKTNIEETLESHLHPLSGGLDGTGWEFSDSPSAQTFISLIKSIDGIETVREFSAALQLPEDRIPLAEGRSPVSLPQDALVCNGTHEITVEVGDHS